MELQDHPSGTHLDSSGLEPRRVRCFTTFGHVVGDIPINASLSTLHFLNVAVGSKEFLVLESGARSAPDVVASGEPLALAASSILFVQELSEFRPVIRDARAAAVYGRSMVRVQLADHQLEGFVHCAPGVNFMARINSEPSPFFAMSSVSVVGRGVQFATPFLAVRRSAVLMAQRLADTEASSLAADEPTVSTEPVPAG